MSNKDRVSKIEVCQYAEEETNWKINELLSDIGRECMLGIMTGESSKGYKKKKMETEQWKTTYKYSQMKRFYHDRQTQIYIYAFMCVYS